MTYVHTIYSHLLVTNLAPIQLQSVPSRCGLSDIKYNTVHLDICKGADSIWTNSSFMDSIFRF